MGPKTALYDMRPHLSPPLKGEGKGCIPHYIMLMISSYNTYRLYLIPFIEPYALCLKPFTVHLTPQTLYRVPYTFNLYPIFFSL